MCVLQSHTTRYGVYRHLHGTIQGSIFLVWRERESRNERLTPVLTVSVGSAIVLDLIYLEEIWARISEGFCSLFLLLLSLFMLPYPTRIQTAVRSCRDMDLRMFIEEVTKKSGSGVYFQKTHPDRMRVRWRQARLQKAWCLSWKYFIFVRLAFMFEVPTATRATFSVFLSCHRLSTTHTYNEPIQRTLYTFLHTPSPVFTFGRHCLTEPLKKLHI